MATTKNTTTLAEPTKLPTPQQVVNDGIVRVIDATGIDIQKNRYKAMRAIAWQSFVNAIEAGDFDALVERAIANVDDLPSGWEIKAPSKAEAAKVAPTKAPIKKAATTATKAATPGRRPVR